MRHGIYTVAPSIAAAVLCSTVILLGACKKGETNGAGDTTATTGMDSSMSASNSAPANTVATAPAGGVMTDAQIFARLIAANQGEIAAGKMAVSKATNAEVKAFARQMISDHTGMLNDVIGLARRLNIIPDNAAADDIQNGNRMTSDQLTAAAKGMTFDTSYVNGQVAGHRAVLEMIQNAASQTQNADLKKALNGAIPAVQHHLDRIKSIQDKMQ